MTTPRATTKQQEDTKNRGNILMGLFIGLILGLGVALAVAIYINFSSLPFIHDPRKPIPLNANSIDKDKTILIQGVQLIDNRPAPTVPPVERVIPTEATQKYQFYHMLTSPQSNTAQSNTEETDTVTQHNNSDHRWPAYVIAGDILTPDAADDLRAQLALSGIEASLQNVQSSHRSPLYRVRIGPFQKEDDIENTITTLNAMHIPAHVIYHQEDDTPDLNAH